MPSESRKKSQQARDAGTLTPEQIQKELDRGRAAAEQERVAALAALHTAQSGKLRVLERELARRERRGQAQSPGTAALRQRLSHLRTRSAVLDNRRARACREWPEPMKDAWILHGFVLCADGSPARGHVVTLHMDDGRAIPGAEGKVEEDGYYKVIIRRDMRPEGVPEREVAPVLTQRETPELARLNVAAVREATAALGTRTEAAAPPEKPEPGRPEQPGQSKPQEPTPGKPEEPPGTVPRTQAQGNVRVSVKKGDDTIYTHPDAVTPRPGVVDYLDIVLPDKGKRSGPC